MTHDPVALIEELHEFGTKLSRTKDGAWSKIAAVLSKSERIHASEARAGAMTGEGSDKPAKTPEQWAATKRGMVTNHHRDNSMASWAGLLIRKGLSDEQCLEIMQRRIAEAVIEVRASGGIPEPEPWKILEKIQSVRKTHERNQRVEIVARPAAKKEQPPSENDPPPPPAAVVQDTTLDTPDWDSDPGGFFAASSGHAGDEVPDDGGVDLDYDQSNPIHRLRDKVHAWHNEVVVKGKSADAVNTKPNIASEFPYHAGVRAKLVMQAFVRWLEDAGGGVVRYRDEWWLYNDGAGNAWTWAPASDGRMAQLFQKFWRAMSKVACTGGRMKDFLGTMASMPEVVRQDEHWNVPLAGDTCGVTLGHDGMLAILERDGALTTRQATRMDMLQATKCPRHAATVAAAFGQRPLASLAPDSMTALRMVASFLTTSAMQDEYVRAMLTLLSQPFMPGIRPKHMYRAGMFIGKPNTGKNTLALELMTAVLGNTLVLPLELEALDEDKFSIADMIGKRMWISTESETGYTLLSDGTLKQIIGNEPMAIRIKHKERLITRLGLTVVAASNDMPALPDTSDGTLLRIVIFPMKVTFVGASEIDPNDPLKLPRNPLLAAIFERERDDLLELLARTASAALAAGDMMVPQWLVDETAATYNSGNPIRAFLAVAVERRPLSDGVVQADIRRAFIGWVHKRYGMKEASQIGIGRVRKLYDALRQLWCIDDGHLKVDGVSEETFFGIHLTAAGLDSWKQGMVVESGRDKSTSEYEPLSKRINRNRQMKTLLGVSAERGATVVPFERQDT